MTPRTLSRRSVVTGLLAAPAVAFLASCGGDGAASSTGTNTVGGTSGTAAPSSTSVTTDADADSATGTTAGVDGTTSTATAGAWASGGTDLITVDYPDDSIFATAATCAVALTAATTEGPCYFQSDTGEDISLGKTGLPMQLCARLVDEQCNPLEGYTIEAWHCDVRGIYSGDTSSSDDADRFAGDFCTAGDAEAEQSTYFRGQLTTDASGRVNFATVFPGWYSGRTIHIHFAVTDPDGTSRVISQWGFPEAFTTEICTTHEQYADRGVQDTPIANDNVFPSEGYEDYLLTLEQNSDGTLLGYGVIQIA
ncbi:dioxygenase-like protein [Ilumatobacter fluminis]|uniref:Dioxygenase-like protein n=1 Tax=Ilumatobacter fluminis TaxID=467091 RepID=A0A4R7I581_9ACTN|nr:intradiol ring-cleavage dioxygenase [Ilumatobacter fluminis]TDT18404.1 dioxygenase-like protein [Ilumatobacter fluminis]